MWLNSEKMLLVFYFKLKFKPPSLPLTLTDLAVPILVAFSSYSKYIAQSDSMKISVMVTDKQKPDNKYLAVNDVVLMNPPISITVSNILYISISKIMLSEFVHLLLVTAIGRHLCISSFLILKVCNFYQRL